MPIRKLYPLFLPKNFVKHRRLETDVLNLIEKNRYELSNEFFNVISLRYRTSTGISNEVF